MIASQSSSQRFPHSLAAVIASQGWLYNSSLEYQTSHSCWLSPGGDCYLSERVVGVVFLFSPLLRLWVLNPFYTLSLIWLLSPASALWSCPLYLMSVFLFWAANIPCRQYQLSITKTALFTNTIVALPTGLGKTLIAAVVMYNYFRWFPTGIHLDDFHSRLNAMFDLWKTQCRVVVARVFTSSLELCILIDQVFSHGSYLLCLFPLQERLSSQHHQGLWWCNRLKLAIMSWESLR